MKTKKNKTRFKQKEINEAFREYLSIQLADGSFLTEQKMLRLKENFVREKYSYSEAKKLKLI